MSSLDFLFCFLLFYFFFFLALILLNETIYILADTELFFMKDTFYIMFKSLWHWLLNICNLISNNLLYESSIIVICRNPLIWWQAYSRSIQWSKLIWFGQSVQLLNDGQMSQWWFLLKAHDGKMLVNDGKRLVNDGEMHVNDARDGEISIWSYTHFTIINEHFTIISLK